MTGRRLSESHAVLWTVILVASSFDIVTTLVGIGIGFQEGNRVAAAFMATYGQSGVALLKFAALVVLAAIWAVLPERPATVVLVGFASISLLAVGLNAITLMGA